MLAKVSPIQNKISSVSTIKQTTDSKISYDLDVPDQFRSKIEQLILQNRHLFACKDSELGHTDVVKMQVDVSDYQPIKIGPYRTPLKNREVIDKAVDEMMNANNIRRSRSPWSFPIVIVGKKDGSKKF